LECIRFRSSASQGTTGRDSTPIWKHELPTTERLIGDIKPKVIVTVGKGRLEPVAPMFPELTPPLTKPLRLREREFEIFTARTSWGSMALAPTRHLTGAWGAPALRIARLGAAIRKAVTARGPS
jgi:hypothetical protein